jgi:aspartate/methionine/tyrosine aminotransferase
MFSRRTPASLAPGGLSRAAAGRRRAGLPLADLTLSNPTRADLEYPAAEILAALGDPRALAYEPSPGGLAAAREAIAAHHGRGAAADRIFLASSTSEAYGWVFKLLCEPGDEVLVPRPSYPLFDCLAALDAVRAVQYPLAELFGWAIDFDALDRRATPRTRAVAAVNPNNPTGHYVTRGDLARLDSWAARRGAALIVDEVFHDYAIEAGPDRASALDAAGEALTFTLSGLSKIAGLPQMKLGWLHAAGPPALVREACERLEWIADAYLPVSAPVQYAAPRWLELAPAIQRAILGRARENLALWRTCLPPESGARARPPGGGWNVVVEVPRTRGEEEWVLALLEEGVLIQPGYFYDFEREGLLVASLLPPPAVTRLGIEALFRQIGCV